MTTKTCKPRSIPKKINVWIVDDDWRYSSIVSEALNESKSVHCSHRFHRCDTFLSALQAGIDFPEIILLDIRLPGMNGLDAIPRIKLISPHSKVIILTAFDNDTYIYKAVTAGANGFLLKDTSAGKMAEAIHKVAGGDVATDDRVLTKLFKILAYGSQSSETYKLTETEKEILRLATEGFTISQIAERLCLSYDTIHTHLGGIHSKLHVHSRSELVAKAIKDKLI